MMHTSNLFIPKAPFHFIKATAEQDRRNSRQRPTLRIRGETEPENRLWKLSMEAASLKDAKLELIALFVFGFLVSAAAVYCGAELLNGVNSGALEQTVRALLSSSSASVTNLVH
jgi:hypothetical protein